ncbi:hypothetical protein [Pararhodobacter sp. CCB-MM2]|uniref:tail fiber domain-containing protein n=1 Tax=Pararhodobacter sp. CCB-MM2 TaxID=1786003 RepID=UPI00082A27C1|nr:hypothetical protein [Pararhodobacter sp. CCB-MM2]
MGKPKAPQSPDPQETAGAQTANNIGTATANAWLTNPSQNTPWGSVTTQQRMDASGNGMFYEYTDPNTGEVFNIPLLEQNTTLTPGQQQLFDTGQQTQQALASAGLAQTNRIAGHLSNEIDTSGVTAGGSADGIRKANLTTKIADAGQIQRDVGGQTLGQNYSGDIADAGAITSTYGTDWSADRQRVEDALYARLNPQLDRDRESLRTSLINQGIREGSTAFDRAMGRLDEQSNDARMQVVLAGGQEQSRLAGLDAQRAAFENSAQQQQFGQNATRTQFANDAQTAINNAKLGQFGVDMGQGEFRNAAQNQQFGQNATSAQFYNDAQLNQQNADMSLEGFKQDLRNAQMGELFALRNQPLNEISALTSGTQVNMPQFPGFNSNAVPTVDRAGLEMQNYQNQMQAYNARMGAWQSGMGGILGLGAALISDQRLKSDIERLGERGPLGVYAFRYLWDKPGVRRIGYMAQEVLRWKPEAVLTMPSGFFAVDYAQLPEV